MNLKRFESDPWQKTSIAKKLEATLFQLEIIGSDKAKSLEKRLRYYLFEIDRLSEDSLPFNQARSLIKKHLES